MGQRTDALADTPQVGGMSDTLWPELSATLKPLTPEQWADYDQALEAAGYYVEHCSHCDRSNRHPSCLIKPIPGRLQLPLPKLP